MSLSQIFKTGVATSRYYNTYGYQAEIRDSVVADVERSTKFYADAFGLSTGFIADGGDYGEIKTGETTLSFSSLKLMR